MTAHYAPHTGGIETHVREVSRRLADRGWGVAVVATESAPVFRREDRIDGLRVTRRRRWPAERDWCFAPGVMRDVWFRRVDLVHVQGVHTFVAPLAMLAASARGVPYVVTLHTGGHSSASRNRIRRLQWSILRPLLLRASSVVAVCEYEVERFGHELGIPDERMELVRNGSEMPPAPPEVPAAGSGRAGGPMSGGAGDRKAGTRGTRRPRRQASDDELLILSVGRLEEYKGHHRVIDAMPALLSRRRVRLVIVGVGPNEEALQQQIERAGLEANVEITSFPPERRGELAGLMAHADAMVLMSQYEAHPVAVMEALSLGCPVVVAETSGLTELARCGWAHGVALDADAGRLADAIEGAAHEGVTAVELPTWDQCTAELEAIYAHAMSPATREAVLAGVSERGALGAPRHGPAGSHGSAARVDARSSGSRHRKASRSSSGSGRRRPASAGRDHDRSGPVLALMALMLAMHAWAGVLNQSGSPWASACYWTSLAAMFVVAAWRIMRVGTTPRERILVAVGLTVALFLSRAVLFPFQFNGHDDLVHLTTLRNLHVHDRLFDSNPLLPASAYYPGLELVAEGLRSLTGFSVHVSGLIVLGLARVITALGLIVLIQRVTRSNRAACIGVLVYATNPQFLFFNSNFSYQSLALPLGIAVLAVLVGVEERRWWSSCALACCCGAVVVVTHHLTSFGLAGVLVLWWVEETVRHRATRRRTAVGITALFVSGSIAGWLLITGDVVVRYLRGIALGTWGDISRQLSGAGGRALFTDYGGSTTPLWERAVSIGSVFVITAAILVALILHGRSLLASGAPAALLLGAAAVYPAIPAGHLTRATAEFGDRLAGFVFVGVATVLGLALHRATERRRSHRGSVTARKLRGVPLFGVVLAFALVFVGGTIGGAGPDWNRMPGPYLVSADSRSVDGANLAAARYAEEHLPADSRIMTDRVNRLLVAAYGGQQPITSLENDIDVSPIMFSRSFDAESRALVRREDVEFAEVDRRLSTGRPRVGVYFEQNEPEAYRHLQPIPRSALDKFTYVDDISRVYDNGAVVFYDLRRVGRDDPSVESGSGR